MTCVVDASTKPATLLCTRCGSTKPWPLPLAISQAVLLINEFRQEHQACQHRSEKTLLTPPGVGATV
jgi:hypothetical protein